MSDNFITNAPEKTLKERVNALLSISDEVKFLVGFVYFSGWSAFKNVIESNPDLKFKVLVGLEVDKYLSQIIEINSNKNLSADDKLERFLSCLNLSINSNEMDTQEVYQSFSFLLELIKSERIKIRKTNNSNITKLYLFKFNPQQSQLQNNRGLFITGTSNLTKLSDLQQEFNVEIRDYGFDKAINYFDDLWEDSIQITENGENKEKFLDLLEYKTLVAKITPFEAYVLVLKTYLDLQLQKKLSDDSQNFIEQIRYKKYKYQLDAVNQALNIIHTYGGCLIADVTGLGKTIIACLIAREFTLKGERGVVICPPSLKENWKGYLDKFKIYNWKIQSRGKLNDLANNIQDEDIDIDIVIVDEAHYFKNPETDSYGYLSSICKKRKVILISATPFNNSPEDIFALLRLFIILGEFTITLKDIETFTEKYQDLFYILKNYNSKEQEKKSKSIKKYEKCFKCENTNLDKNGYNKTNDEMKILSEQLKGLISPFIIRRNRLDLLNDFEYKKEISSFSEISDPKQIYFELSEEQDKFFDNIILWFGSDQEKRRVTGAIYQPFKYTTDKNLVNQKNKKEQKKVEKIIDSQKNLFYLMRSLLIRRFESSFGAFSNSIDTFLDRHKKN